MSCEHGTKLASMRAFCGSRLSMWGKTFMVLPFSVAVSMPRSLGLVAPVAKGRAAEIAKELGDLDG